jgi:predicted TIM-barrel fold metal-dependent hydrolase
MHATGIRAAIIGPTAVGSSQIHGVEDTRRQNGVIARARRDFPDRFPIGLALIEPRHDLFGPEELERAMSEEGLCGIMYHPSGGGLSIGDELNDYLEVASMRKGLCLLHGFPPSIGRLARRFPGCTFFAHAGDLDAAVEECASLDNVWFEIVQRPQGPQSSWDFKAMINRLGVERLVFGSDTPYYDFRVLQHAIENAHIEESAKDAIAYRNAVRLIRSFVPGYEIPGQPVEAPQIYDDAELWPVKGERFTA